MAGDLVETGTGCYDEASHIMVSRNRCRAEAESDFSPASAIQRVRPERSDQIFTSFSGSRPEL